MEREFGHGKTTQNPSGYDVEQALQTFDQPDSSAAGFGGGRI